MYLYGVLLGTFIEQHMCLSSKISYQQTPEKTENTGEHKKTEHINALVS